MLFFAIKPSLAFSGHGQLYFEGKEFEVKLKAKQPGVLSDELMRALGMSNGEKSPPPWLPLMQRYGPPPAYMHLKIPGVNAQIPPGARWGTGENEWGKPPVDQYARPLWGDVFAASRDDGAANIDTTLWAPITESLEGEELEAEDEDESEEDENGEEGTETPSTVAGDETPSGFDSESGFSSTASTFSTSGMETPESLQLRKKDGTGTETPDQIRKDAPRSLYTVLEQKQVEVGSGLFGTTHTYVMPQAGAGAGGAATAMSEAERALESKKKAKRGEVDVALNPDDLESGVDAETLKRKYELQLEAEKVGSAPAMDMSDLMDERSKKKRKVVGGQKSKMKKIF